MKQKRRFLFLLLASFLLPFNASCSQKESQEDKVRIGKVLNAKTTYLLSSEKEVNDIVRYEDAVLFISKVGCSHCENQRKFLYRMIEETHDLIYEVDIETYLALYDSQENKNGTYAYLFPRIEGTPTLLFYAQGKLKNTYTGEFHEDYSKARSTFLSYVRELPLYLTNDYVSAQNSYYHYAYFQLDEDALYWENTFDQLDEFLSQAKNVMIYYSWRRCSDCKSYDENILYPFLEEHPDITLYVYEVDGFYQKKRRDDEEGIQREGLKEWADFSLSHHLITLDYYNTDIYGNQAGVTPTLVYYGENGYEETSIYHNDMNPILNEDGTLSYSMAFYPEVKALKSKTKVEKGDVVSSAYRTALRELSSKAEPIETEKGKAFLSSHLL